MMSGFRSELVWVLEPSVPSFNWKLPSQIASTVSELLCLPISLCVVTVVSTVMVSWRRGTDALRLLSVALMNPFSMCERLSATRTMIIVGYIAYEHEQLNLLRDRGIRSRGDVL